MSMPSAPGKMLAWTCSCSICKTRWKMMSVNYNVYLGHSLLQSRRIVPHSEASIIGIIAFNTYLLSVFIIQAARSDLFLFMLGETEITFNLWLSKRTEHGAVSLLCGFSLSDMLQFYQFFTRLPLQC